jgi:hypothetical protein
LHQSLAYPLCTPVAGGHGLGGPENGQQNLEKSWRYGYKNKVYTNSYIYKAYSCGKTSFKNPKVILPASTGAFPALTGVLKKSSGVLKDSTGTVRGETPRKAKLHPTDFIFLYQFNNKPFTT